MGGRYSFPWPVQVIVSPLVRLTNASDPPLEDVGTLEGLLNSLGSYITCGPCSPVSPLCLALLDCTLSIQRHRPSSGKTISQHAHAVF